MSEIKSWAICAFAAPLCFRASVATISLLCFYGMANELRVQSRDRVRFISPMQRKSDAGPDLGTERSIILSGRGECPVLQNPGSGVVVQCLESTALDDCYMCGGA